MNWIILDKKNSGMGRQIILIEIATEDANPQPNSQTKC